MGNTFRQSGDLLDYTPATAKTANEWVLEGNIVGVCPESIAAGEPGVLEVTGIHEAPAKSADTPAFGTIAYWDNTAKEFTVTQSTNTRAGHFVRTKASGETTALVRIRPA